MRLRHGYEAHGGRIASGADGRGLDLPAHGGEMGGDVSH
jgi:hypothetical protein